ncbi:MAG: D-tyrosyl-tRNA(Tyr) deacylase [Clostridia bacterium]|nr:D-tyrosyl-tRNA(Tyr) deacylase [Clostridia bacterium]
MKAVVQRVASAAVKVEGKTVGEIEKGLLVLLGVTKEDTEEDAQILAKKMASMRIFTDENGKMNLSVKDIGGSVLVISNFTLCADIRKGTRPSFDPAMPPAEADRLYEYFCKLLSEQEAVAVETGVFGAEMKVSLLNDGPVTLTLDSTLWRK